MSRGSPLLPEPSSDCEGKSTLLKISSTNQLCALTQINHLAVSNETLHLPLCSLDKIFHKGMSEYMLNLWDVYGHKLLNFTYHNLYNEQGIFSLFHGLKLFCDD
jgi:hypothetical protein